MEPEQRWPDEPYKGVGYYGPEDILLFAGRDAEILECAYKLTSMNTRILLLYGETGFGNPRFYEPV